MAQNQVKTLKPGEIWTVEDSYYIAILSQHPVVITGSNGESITLFPGTAWTGGAMPVDRQEFWKFQATTGDVLVTYSSPAMWKKLN